MKTRFRIPRGSTALLVMFLLLVLWPRGVGWSVEKESSVTISPVAPAATDKQRVLYEDDEFKMVGVGYGSAGASSKPGFYVFRKARADWIRIDTVSTKNGTFGRSPTLEEVKKAGKAPPSIGWDFRPLSKQPSVTFPLSFGGFLFFPDSVTRDGDKGEYVLRFNSNWEIPGVETILRIAIDDLR